MSGIYPPYAPVIVPYQHKVRAVAPVAATSLSLDGPHAPYPRDQTQKATQPKPAPRGQYNALNAGAGFAIHILVEAGQTGKDPFAGARGSKAYSGQPFNRQTVHLTA